MSRYIITILAFLVFNSGISQLNEDFSDGELLSNPTWEGDLADFIINENGQLQLNAFSGAPTSLFTL